MKHIVSISGGVSSAVAADRVMQRYGKEDVTLWFADTSWEDSDLYRFMFDCSSRWNKWPVIYKDGRNPIQVFTDEHIIPNSRIAPCTFRLKIEPFMKYVTRAKKPVTVHLGMDWTEEHRMTSPRERYEAIEGVTVEFPLTWEPVETRSYFEIIEKDWGIEIPRLYTESFPHNNCGGRCVKQGQAGWKTLRMKRQASFNEVRDWELWMKSQGGAAENYTIMKRQKNKVTEYVTLAQLEDEWEQSRELQLENKTKVVLEDAYTCHCTY